MKTGQNKREAQKLGLKTYQVTSSCKRRHEPIRYTNDGACVGCIKFYNDGARDKKKIKNIEE